MADSLTLWILKPRTRCWGFFLGLRGHGEGGQKRYQFEIIPWPFFLSLWPLLFFFLFSISFFPEIRWRRSLAWQTEVTTQGGCKRNTLKRAAQAQSEVPKEENNPVTILDQNATFPQIWGQLVLQVLLKLLNKNQIQSWWKSPPKNAVTVPCHRQPINGHSPHTWQRISPQTLMNKH